MNECKKCGVENKIESVFCKACGERLVKHEVINEEATMIGISDVTEKSEVNNEGQGQVREEGTNIIDKVKSDIKENKFLDKVKSDIKENNFLDKVKNKFKGKKKHLMIVVASFVTLVLVGAIAVGASTFFSPEKRVIGALYNLRKTEEHKGSIVASLDSRNKEIPDIVEDMSVEFFYDYNLKKQEYKLKGVLSVSEEPIVEVLSLIDKEDIYIDTVDLYKKPFYINQGKEYALILEDSNKFLEYLKGAKLKGVDKGIYIDALAKALESNIEKESGKIILDLTPNTLYEIAVSLSRVVKDDEKFAGALYDDIYKIEEKIKKDKYKFKSEQFKNIEDLLEDLPSKEEFEKKFADIIDNMYQNAKYQRKMAKQDDSELEVEVIFDISMLNKIKTVEVNVDIEDFKGTALLETGKTFKSKSYKRDSSIDLEDIVDTDEVEDIGMEIVKNLSDKILNNNRIIKYLESSDVSRQLKRYFGTTDVREILEEVLEENL